MQAASEIVDELADLGMHCHLAELRLKLSSWVIAWTHESIILTVTTEKLAIVPRLFIQVIRPSDWQPLWFGPPALRRLRVHPCPC